MYMPDTKILRWYPTQPIFHWLAFAKKCASPNARDTNMLVYFALGNTKFWRWVHCPTPTPDARYFAFWWNIGLNVHAQRKNPTPGTQRNLYSTGNGVPVGYPTRMKSTQKNEMYMADARNLRHLTQKIPTCWYPCVR